jgi:hypothetical protein
MKRTKTNKANVFLGYINKSIVKIKKNTGLEHRKHSVNVFLNRVELSDHIWNIVFHSWCHMLRVALPKQTQGDSACEHSGNHVR